MTFMDVCVVDSNGDGEGNSGGGDGGGRDNASAEGAPPTKRRPTVGGKSHAPLDHAVIDEAATEGKMPLPVWNGSGDVPPLCGRVPWPSGQVIPPKSLAAAKTATRSRAQVDWILARVTGYNRKDRAYLLQDEFHVSKTLTVPENNVMPLASSRPKNWTAEAEYPIKSSVIAMFPETTEFYTATVVSLPKQHADKESYGLRFADDEEDPASGDVIVRTVSARYVLGIPE